MSGPPPPPPPHGENPKSSSGLPPGKYDIFIIPEHSAGSGFLYLPSLKPNVNSFAAGFASALILVVVGTALAPAVQAWWNSVKGAGGAGMIMLMLAVGVGAWALGRIQTDGGPGPGGGRGASPGAGAPPPTGNAHPGPQSSHSTGYAGGPPPNTAPPPGAGSMPGGHGGPSPGGWQRSAPPPGATGPSQDAGGAAKSAWEKAREDTRKREEEKKARDAEQKRKAELEKRLKELREREAREREAREQKLREEGEKTAREKMRKEQEAKEAKMRKEQEAKDTAKKEEEAREAKKKEDEARLKKLRDEADRLRRRREFEEREQKRKEGEAASKKAEEESKPRGSAYAFSAVGEKTNPWPTGRPPSPTKAPSSPPKRPPPPTAKTYRGTDDDAHSYRPYDRPKRPLHKKSKDSLHSESSYAASQSTSRTTPPPSHRGPYSTKDPDKIVIKAVYAFNNAFLKTPTSQLVSGVGSVTDGLILRITTEGLFIDDDVRGVPQREWDVKAWTMKLVEVWCPSFRQGPAGVPAATAARVASEKSKNSMNMRRLWGLDKEKPASSEETDALLIEMLGLCKNNCRLRAASSASSMYSESSYASDSAYGSSVGSGTNYRGAGQTGENKNVRLHVLRASIRDQEGKKYVFIIGEEESWKVAVGLQRLRKGTQVRALGVSGMSSSDAKGTLEHLGWV